MSESIIAPYPCNNYSALKLFEYLTQSSAKQNLKVQHGYASTLTSKTLNTQSHARHDPILSSYFPKYLT